MPKLASTQSRLVKAKRKCCKSGPRCKRCPVVLERLGKAELAERVGKRHWQLSPRLRKKALKKARKRAAA